MIQRKYKAIIKQAFSPKSSQECPNCRETNQWCACMRSKCVQCDEPVGNITFTVCDNCWNKWMDKLEAEQQGK